MALTQILVRHHITLQKAMTELQNKSVESEISGSHGGEYEDGCLLGCCAV
jgi:hypothetical protein